MLFAIQISVVRRKGKVMKEWVILDKLLSFFDGLLLAIGALDENGISVDTI
jgi:hypothetical protein